MTYLFVLVMLLLPVPGWAGEKPNSASIQAVITAPKCKVVNSESQKVYATWDCQIENGVVTMKENTCLDKMQAAMRAMEPYLLNPLGVTQEEIANGTIMKVDTDKRRADWKVWQSAKRACWKETP